MRGLAGGTAAPARRVPGLCIHPFTHGLAQHSDGFSVTRGEAGNQPRPVLPLRRRTRCSSSGRSYFNVSCERVLPLCCISVSIFYSMSKQGIGKMIPKRPRGSTLLLIDARAHGRDITLIGTYALVVFGKGPADVSPKCCCAGPSVSVWLCQCSSPRAATRAA